MLLPMGARGWLPANPGHCVPGSFAARGLGTRLLSHKWGSLCPSRLPLTSRPRAPGVLLPPLPTSASWSRSHHITHNQTPSSPWCRGGAWAGRPGAGAQTLESGLLLELKISRLANFPCEIHSTAGRPGFTLPRSDLAPRERVVTHSNLELVSVVK